MLLSLSPQEVDIDSHFKSFSMTTRQSLEAWSGSQLDLGLVCIFMTLDFTRNESA